MKMLALYVVFNLVNVVFATVKSLATIKCSKSVSAIINGLYYALYYTVIINLAVIDGIPMALKAVIIAVENVIGVYIASALFERMFSKDIRWEVRVSLPAIEAPYFITKLAEHNLDYYICGSYEDWVVYSVFCDNKEDSRALKNAMPSAAKYNIVEDRKRL